MCYRIRKNKSIQSLEDLKGLRFEETVSILIPDVVSIPSLKKSVIVLGRTCQSLPM